MDAFIASIPRWLYYEWMAFDSIEPLDASGLILKGLAGPDKPDLTPEEAEKQMIARLDGYMGARK